MKIADYGKAITSYIESPTTAQKLQAKEKAQTLGMLELTTTELYHLQILNLR